MQKHALQRDLPAPDEAYARHHCLHQGVVAPDLVTIKDFFRFYIATSCGRIVVKLENLDLRERTRERRLQERLFQHLYLLRPERCLLARMMASKNPCRWPATGRL